MRTALVFVLLLSGCEQTVELSPGGTGLDTHPSPRIYVIGRDAAEDAANGRIRDRLTKEIKGTDGPHRLVNVIDYIRNQAELNLIVNWTALEGAGVDIDTIVAKLPDSTAQDMLKLALSEATGPKALVPLDFYLRDGIVHVSTREELRRHTVIRIYVLPATLFQSSARLATYSTATFDFDSAQLPAYSFVTPLENIDLPGPSDIETGAQLMEMLSTLVQDTVGLQSDWAAYGGEVSWLRVVNGVMIVRTNRESHAELERLLSQICAVSPAGWLRETEANYLVMRAEASRLAGRHAEALRMVDDALFVQPTSLRALALKKVLAGTLGERFVLPVPSSEPRGPIEEDLLPTVGPPVGFTQKTQRPDREGEIIRRFEMRLADPMPINFEGSKLVNIIDYFRNTVGVSFFVDWAALERAGIEQDTPISLQLENVPAGVALDLVLRQASAGVRKDRAAFVIGRHPTTDDHIQVNVSMEQTLEATGDTRVYHIRDLLDWGVDDYSVNLMHGRNDLRSVASMRFEVNKELGVEPVHVEELTELLVDLVPQFVGRVDGWAAYGGDAASLRELNSNLIIRAPLPWHRQVESFLANLRLARLLSTIALMQHREVLHLLYHADALRLEQRYPQALGLTEQALRVDGSHTLALAMKQVIEETIARRRAAGR